MADNGMAAHFIMLVKTIVTKPNCHISLFRLSACSKDALVRAL